MRLLGTLLVVALLAGQEPTREEQLQQERRVAFGGSPVWLVTVIARFQDGTPARGMINCNGNWCKFDEVKYCADNLPFETDSRGACIFNPPIDWFDGEYAERMTCFADSNGRTGRLTFTPYNRGIFIITLPGSFKPVQK